MDIDKRTICGIYKIDKKKVHNINHENIANNIILGRRKLEPSRVNGWTVEDCKIIMVYMCRKYHNLTKKLFELQNKSK